jgi:hypothetical protein
MVLLALVLLVAACSNEPAPVDTAGTERPSRRPKPSATEPDKTPEPEPDAELLIYVKNNTLRGFDVTDGNDTQLRSVPGPDVALSPDGRHIAVVVDHDPGGDPEGYSDPFITLAEVFPRGEDVELGPGAAPHWSPNGKQIAATTEEGVVTYDIASGGSNEVLTGQGWNVLGWSGARVAAVGQGTTVLADEDDAEDLGFEPSVVWGVSPATQEVLLAGEGPPELIEGDASTTVAMDGVVADGAWSPDGRRIAVVAVGKGPDGAVMVDTTTGQVTKIDEGVGAQGNVVWAADSRTYAFVRIDPGNNLALQAVVCEVDGGCRPGFTWGQGVVLLGFADA